MLELFGLPLGTVFQGATFATVFGGICAIVITYIRGGPDRRRAEDDDDTNLRRDLMARVSELERLRAQDRVECIDEQDRLRAKIYEHEDTIRGLHRQIIHLQRTWFRTLPPNLRTPEIEAMEEQLHLADNSGEAK